MRMKCQWALSGFAGCAIIPPMSENARMKLDLLRNHSAHGGRLSPAAATGAVRRVRTRALQICNPARGLMFFTASLLSVLARTFRLNPRGWESFRVTSRGGAGNVAASVRFLADGPVLILR